MATTTLSTICYRAGLTKARVARWISDGNFALSDPPANGKARAWGLEDTVRLLALARLVDAGCPVEIGRAIHSLTSYRSQAYLVVTASPKIAFADLLGGGIVYSAEAVTEGRLVEILRLARRWRALHVVDLTDIEQQAERIMRRPEVSDGEEGA